MIKAVIIDDEKKSRGVLNQLLKETDQDIIILNEASSVEEGVQLIKKEAPQLVFLDVEMLDGTGFNLLEQFDEIPFEVIFTTAYDHYAIKAFKYSAIDYLLKPVNVDELEEAIIRVEEVISKKTEIGSQIDVLLANIQENNKSKKIAIKSADRIDFVEVGDIIYCSSESSYTEIIMTRNRKVLATKPLKYFDEILSVDFDFFRVSRIHLINPSFISSYKKEKELVELGKGIEIEVSRRRKKEFLLTLGIK